MESTVTFKAYRNDGTVGEVRTTRHQAGFRLDIYANALFPHDKVAISYTDNNDVKASVTNTDGNLIAEFVLVKDT